MGAIEIQIRVGNINKPSLGSLASRRKIPRVLRLLASYVIVLIVIQYIARARNVADKGRRIRQNLSNYTPLPPSVALLT